MKTGAQIIAEQIRQKVKFEKLEPTNYPTTLELIVTSGLMITLALFLTVCITKII